MHVAIFRLKRKQKAFLAAYIECGTVAAACRASEVGRRTHYDWMQNEPAYAAAFAEAEQESIELLEASVRRRAIEGVREPVIYKGELQFALARDKETGEVLRTDNGKVIYTDEPLIICRPSENLSMFLLKAKRPDVYRDNSKVEVGGANGGPLALQVTFVKADDSNPVSGSS